jgi:predicted nucleic acid-binding protein
MLILDTNVLSALMRESPDEGIRTWLDRQPRSAVWTTTVTIMELRHGLALLPESRRKTRLEQAFVRLVETTIEAQVMPFDLVSADAAGRLAADLQRAGRTVEIRDTMIAGIALAHHATVVTCNTRHFRDLSVPVIDPRTA